MRGTKEEGRNEGKGRVGKRRMEIRTIQEGRNGWNEREGWKEKDVRGTK